MPDSSFIVGDAGGTKTAWRVVDRDNIQQFTTIGFNAHTHSLSDLKENIAQALGAEAHRGRPVYLYAAGVNTAEQKEEAEVELRQVMGKDLIVENDLLGTARALCEKKQGNICILGTGSNACFYNGEHVNKVSASLGYILGDEGSGAYLGKKLLMKIFRNQVDEDIIDSFQKEYDLTPHRVIQQIYHKPIPNHFLASFAPFILKHREHPEIYQLIYEAFKDFYHAFFAKNEHENKAFYFSGSIAYHFSDVLRKVGRDHDFQIRNIIESPIAGLVLYHQQYD